MLHILNKHKINKEGLMKDEMCSDNTALQLIQRKHNN